MRLTSEQIAMAKEIPIEQIASAMGYTLVRKGNYFSLKEMDSLMIHTKKNRWWRYSNNQHGNSIDFMMQFGNYNFIEASIRCLEIGNISIKMNQGETDYMMRKEKSHSKKKEIREMRLPQKADNFRRLYAYLMKRRMLSADTIRFFIKHQLMYEDNEYHNIIFLGKSADGKIHYAAKHGTVEMNGRRAFRGDVAGNDKSYGVNLCNPESKKVVVFEAAIDMMSYFEIEKQAKIKCQDNLLVLGMLSDTPLETFLNENKQIREIVLALDHDEKGMEAMEKLKEKYKKRGFLVKRYLYPDDLKDVNEFLKKLKRQAPSE